MYCLLPFTHLSFWTSNSLNVLHTPPKLQWSKLGIIVYLTWLRTWGSTLRGESPAGDLILPFGSFVTSHVYWRRLQWKSTIQWMEGAMRGRVKWVGRCQARRQSLTHRWRSGQDSMGSGQPPDFFTSYKDCWREEFTEIIYLHLHITYIWK